MRLLPIDSRDIPRAWPRLGPFLARACMRPGCDHTETSLAAACLAQEAQLIAVLDDVGRSVAAGVTQVRETPEGRSCWILALGGARTGSWTDVIAEIEAGAARAGCNRVEFVGRRAWMRVHPDYVAEPCGLGIHFMKRLEA